VDQANAESTNFFTKAWWSMRDANAVANTFGHAGSLTGSGNSDAIGAWVAFGATFATQGVPLVSAVAGMTTIQSAVINTAVMHLADSTTLAVDFAGGVSTVNTPLILDTVTVAPPEWMMEAMGSYAPNALMDGVQVNITPAIAFTAISVTAKVLPIIL